MILWVRENGRNHAVVHPENGRPFILCGHESCILTPQTGFRTPEGTVLEKADEKGSVLALYNCTRQVEALIYPCRHERGYGIFRHYCPKSLVISAGSDLLDDFYLDDPRIGGSQIMIDLYQHTIEDTAASGLCAVNGVPFEKTEFHEGDLLQFLNVQMILLDGMIAVNTVENLCTGFREEEHRDNEKIYTPEKEVTVRRIYRNPHFMEVFEKDLEEPDPLPAAQKNSMAASMGMTLMMSGGALAVALLNAHTRIMDGQDPLQQLTGIAMPLLMLAASLIFRPLQHRLEKKADETTVRTRASSYSRYLGNLGASIRRQQLKSLETREECFPAMQEIENLTCSSLIYQKLPDQEDWLMIRAGKGDLDCSIVLSHSFRFIHDDCIPIMISNLIHQLQTLHNAVITFSLKEYRKVALEDDEERFLCALLQQLCLFYAPDLIRLVFLADESWVESHAWIRAIPHTQDHTGVRMIAVTENEARRLSVSLQQEKKSWPVFIVQRPSLLNAMDQSEGSFVTLVENHAVPADTDLRIVCRKDGGELIDENGIHSFSSTFTEQNPFDFFASLQRFHLEGEKCTASAQSDEFMDLYGVNDAEGLDIAERWRRNHLSRKLEVILGRNASDENILLDLDENGNGPHGLIAGMTGSGKSELIISLVLALAVNYGPKDVQFVMIDFKGGGASQVFANKRVRIPHIAGVLSNLQVDDMERALVSFGIECRGREHLFSKMSEITSSAIMNLHAYQKEWREDCGLPQLASLVIIVDEFAELKKEKPEFMKELISLARVGRSLGIHLILATQKPAGVVDDQILANSRFKICLKVQDKEDSTEMIHMPDASWIRKPGEFYMLCDGMIFHGNSGYAGAPAGQKMRRASLLSHDHTALAAAKIGNVSRDCQASAIVNEIARIGKIDGFMAEGLWLEALQSIDASAVDDERGLVLGIEDDFYHHAQPFVFYERERGMHMAVFTIDRSEKLSFARMLIRELLVKTHPETEIHVIDEIGLKKPAGKTSTLCSWIRADETDKIRQLFRHLEVMHAENGNEAYVIITDISAFYDSCEDHKQMLHRMLEKGEQKKVHFVLFASAFSTFSYRDLTMIPFRIALHNENLQELTAILETTVRRVVKKVDTGLVKEEHVLEFIWPKISEEDLEEAIRQRSEKYGSRPLYTIPFVPQHISISDYHGSGFPLGMDHDSCCWVEVGKNESFLVLSQYEDEYEPFMKLCRTLGRKIIEQPDEETLNNLLAMQNAAAFLLYTPGRRMKYLTDRSAVRILYIGESYRKNQYDFGLNVGKEFLPNMGVLFTRGRGQVIQIAEKL